MIHDMWVSPQHNLLPLLIIKKDKRMSQRVTFFFSSFSPERKFIFFVYKNGVERLLAMAVLPEHLHKPDRPKKKMANNILISDS